MASTANFASTPRCNVAQLGVANTNRDGTGTINTVFTAAVTGSRIDTIMLKATGTTTAGMIRLYVHDGTNARLLTEVPVLAVTPSSTSPAWEAQITTGSLNQVVPIILPNGNSLRASTEVANTINIVAIGGDF